MKDKIISLINQGLSINRISKKLGGISKGTIYYHYKKIKGRKIKRVRIKRDDLLIGEFIGLFAGDGNFFKTKQYHYRIRIFCNAKDVGFVSQIEEMFQELFSKSPFHFINKRGDVVIICYSSKKIYELIKQYLYWDEDNKKTYTVCLNCTEHSDQFKIGFLRGNLDSDGHLSKNKINFASSSKSLITNIKGFLDDFNFKYTFEIRKDKRKNRVDMYHITLSRKDRWSFLKLVNPRNTRILDAPAEIRIPARE